MPGGVSARHTALRDVQVRPRSIAELYQVAARVWLTAALASLLLPESERIGIWLPLHLTLAGSATAAICGAMQTFVLAMTATKSPSTFKTILQFTLINTGALLIAFGYPSGRSGLVAAGGAAFVIATLILGDIVRVAWKKALNKRHPLPVAMYAAAVGCLLVGGTLGAMVGAHEVTGTTWVALRGAHLTLNVLGWVSLTIAGTLITLLPTVLRVRMPAWRGRATAWALVGGVVGLALGLALRSSPLLAAGGVVYALGACGIAWMAVRVASTPRKWPVPVSAKHLMCALVWFVFGSADLAVQAVRGPEALIALRPVFLTVFVGGWIVQTLLGAWLFLLPMWRAGHPEERRRSWAAVDYLAGPQVVALNLGLVILAFRSATATPGTAAALGAGLALGGGLMALIKAWAFRWIARAPVVTPRTRAMWWADE